MAINDMMAPADDDELARALNNKALQDLMTQEDAAGLPGGAGEEDQAKALQDLTTQQGEAGLGAPIGMETRDMAPEAPPMIGEGPIRKLMPVKPPIDPASLETLIQAKLGGGGGLGGALGGAVPGGDALGGALGGAFGGGGGTSMWKAPLAAASLGGGMPSGLGQLIKAKATPPALGRGLPGVPGSAGLGKAIGKAPAALSRGLPGVPGSKAVGKGLSKGVKKVGQGIGKLFGRR